MNRLKLQMAAIQKTIELSEQEALKVLVFMAGLKAGEELQLAEKMEEKTKCDRAS